MESLCIGKDSGKTVRKLIDISDRIHHDLVSVNMFGYKYCSPNESSNSLVILCCKYILENTGSSTNPWHLLFGRSCTNYGADKMLIQLDLH